jgi:deazaflavin-dependent oxidoreductase (nitroreductase family)
VAEPGADPEFAYLTTVGRRTGARHTVELWYRRIGDTVWFLAGQRSDWIANARATPGVTVRIGPGELLAGTARIETGDDGGAAAARRALASRATRAGSRALPCRAGRPPRSPWPST